MEHQRFDDLARAMVSVPSRRALVQGLVGGALAPLLVLFSSEPVAAGCVGVGNKCGRGDKCCDGARCKRRRCRCQRGLRKCGRECRQCCKDAHCRSGVCRTGRCRPATCTDGVKNGDESDIDCGGSCEPCADGKTCDGGGDCASGHCCDGTCAECCGHADCASGVCGNDGICQAPACDDGVKNGDETDIDCGGPTCPACGHDKSCQGDADCTSARCCNGICRNVECCGDNHCTGGATCCGGNCTDLQSSQNHCGTCGNACRSSQTCQSGQCQAAICAGMPTTTCDIEPASQCGVATDDAGEHTCYCYEGLDGGTFCGWRGRCRDCADNEDCEIVTLFGPESVCVPGCSGNCCVHPCV